MLEMEFLVTESASRRGNIEYLKKTLSRQISAFGGSYSIDEQGDRCYFLAKIDNVHAKYFTPTLEDKLADIIAIKYKYDYFKKHIRVGGLKPVEYELLLSAMISADIEEDKRYARGKLTSSPYAIDGSFNFQMKPLLEKWQEIVGYIPSYFASYQLKEFISYIIDEKKGSRVFVVGDNVYDSHYNRLIRANLTEDSDCHLIKEIILSNSGEVELSSPLPEQDEFYLKQFFGNKIFFNEQYHKQV